MQGEGLLLLQGIKTSCKKVNRNYNFLMRRIAQGVIIFLIFLLAIPGSASGSTLIPPPEGLVVSEMSLDYFSIEYPELPVGIYKVNDAVSLYNNVYFASAHNIPIFARINLFSYSLISEEPQDIDALRSYYLSIPIEDIIAREKVLSAILYHAQDEGKPLAFSIPEEPHIEITYKVERTKSGEVRIPVRNVIQGDKIVTYFLLDASKGPSEERLSPMDIAKIYDIDTCLHNLVVIRNKYDNENVDFLGFFVDVPHRGIAENYLKSVESSLKELVSYLHKQGKLLLVQNLTYETLEMGEFGDLVGLRITEDNLALLEKARLRFKDRTIFATYDGDFSNWGNVERFLNECTLYGIYPEFGRDTSSGEFYYYEKAFGENEERFKDYSTIIKVFNQAGFVEEITSDSSRIVRFGEYPFLNFAIFHSKPATVCVDGTIFKGSSDFKIVDFKGNSVNFTLRDSSVYIELEGSGYTFLRVLTNDFSPVYIGTFLSNSLLGRANTILVNAGEKGGVVTLKFLGGDSLVSQDFTMEPLGERKVLLQNVPTQVEFKGVVYDTPLPEKKGSSAFLWIVPLLIICLIFLFNKRISLKKGIKSRDFYVLSILLPSLLIFINREFIHYSSITILYFVFALLFFIASFHQKESFRVMFFDGLLMLILGFVFNFFEFGTFLPYVFNDLPPFESYLNFIFYIPFILTLIYFFNVNSQGFKKIELVYIIIVLIGAIFFFDNFSLPFEFDLSLRSLLSIVIIFAGFILLQIFERPIGTKDVLLPILALCIALSTIPLNRLLRYNILMRASPPMLLLFLKDFHLFSVPLFFVSVFDYGNRKIRKGGHYASVVYIIFYILVAFYFLSQYTFKQAGTTFVSGFVSLIINAIIITLLFMLLLEPSRNDF